MSSDLRPIPGVPCPDRPADTTCSRCDRGLWFSVFGPKWFSRRDDATGRLTAICGDCLADQVDRKKGRG